MTLIIWQF